MTKLNPKWIDLIWPTIPIVVLIVAQQNQNNTHSLVLGLVNKSKVWTMPRPCRSFNIEFPSNSSDYMQCTIYAVLRFLLGISLFLYTQRACLIFLWNDVIGFIFSCLQSCTNLTACLIFQIQWKVFFSGVQFHLYRTNFISMSSSNHMTTSFIFSMCLLIDVQGSCPHFDNVEATPDCIHTACDLRSNQCQTFCSCSMKVSSWFC